MGEIRAVLIGFGGMGSQYARMLQDHLVEGMQLSGICCRNAAGQEIIRRDYPGVTIYHNTDDVFSHREAFDLVIIVTPHDTHAAIGRQAFLAGKHVICDKPAGISTKEVKEMMEAWKKAGTVWSMIYNTRTTPAFKKAKEMLEEGAVGRLTRAVWVCNTWFRTPAYHHAASWRSTWSGEHGGLLINQCQHYLDIWQWLLGMPDRIDASIDFGKYNDFMVDDSVDLRLLYDDGLRGTFISSSGEAPATNRFEIWGTKGKLTVEDGTSLTLDENLMETTEFAGVNTEIYGELSHRLHKIPLPEKGSPYQILFQNVSDHIRMGEPLICTGEDGWKGVELANASYLSAWLGHTIKLPVDDEMYVHMLQGKIEEEQEKMSGKP